MRVETSCLSFSSGDIKFHALAFCFDFDFVPPSPPNFPQIIQYKGFTCIIYKNKDLAP